MRPMVRRDEADNRPSASRCSSPAGASPALVSAGAPSSRPRVRVERRVAQAGCQEPLRREPVRGPQPYVKLAASSDSQSERRTGHLAVKTTSRALQSGDARARELGGVRSAARGHGAERNTRSPSVRPESGQRRSYKPSAKASAAQRESEGTTVASRPVTNNAGGAKGPCGGKVGRASTREGMTGRTGSNHPAGRELSVKARHPQHRLGSRPSDGWSAQLLRCSSRRSDLLREPRSFGRFRSVCVTPRSDRPPVSRVREIRTHGLNGGLTHIRPVTRTGDSRIYQ